MLLHEPWGQFLLVAFDTNTPGYQTDRFVSADLLIDLCAGTIIWSEGNEMDLIIC